MDLSCLTICKNMNLKWDGKIGSLFLLKRCHRAVEQNHTCSIIGNLDTNTNWSNLLGCTDCMNCLIRAPANSGTSCERFRGGSPLAYPTRPSLFLIFQYYSVLQLYHFVLPQYRNHPEDLTKT